VTNTNNNLNKTKSVDWINQIYEFKLKQIEKWNQIETNRKIATILKLLSINLYKSSYRISSYLD